MSLPAGVDGVTVSSGKPLALPDGTPFEGKLLFSGPDVVTVAGQEVLLGGTKEVKLEAGEFSVLLAANDVTGMNPSGWTYRVTAAFSNAPGWVRYISLPKASPSVTLAEVIVPDPVAGAYSTLIDASAVAATFLAKAQNLADLPNKVMARTNLDLGGAAVLDVGTTADTVAAGDDPRFSSSKPWVFDVTKYGAAGDAQAVADGAMTSGSAVLTSATANWPPSVVGKAISVKGAGPTGVTTLDTTVASRQSSTQITLAAANASGGAVSGAIVIWGTDDNAAAQAATDAAWNYLAAGNTYAEVFCPRPTITAGPLNTSKHGNGQLVFDALPTSGVKKHLFFTGPSDGAAAVRHWQQGTPQFAGGCLISFGAYSSAAAQTADINAHGNPAVICGPNEGSGYGAAANFSNIMVGIKNLTILTTHSAYGLTYGAFNLYGCANAYLENVGYGTAGVVPGGDYTSPGTFGTGLSIGGLLPAPGNNDHVIARNVSCGGGYTYALFLTEHAIVDRYMALYCWAGLCAVGNYFGSVGSVHAMKVLSASIEACTHELYIVGAGSDGVGPIIDIDQLSTESSTPNIAGNSSGAMAAALGRVKLTGLFTESGVSVSSPTGIELVNGQVPRAIKRKSSTFTCSPIDRTLVCDTSAGAFTGTLPAADFNPVEYVLKNVGTNDLTVSASDGQLIYIGSGTGVATTTVAAGQTLRVQAHYTGSAWVWQAVTLPNVLPLTGGTITGDLTVNGTLAGPVGAYGTIAPSRTSPAWRPALTSYQFQAGHGWSTNGTASNNLNNTSGPIRGSQYASITTDTAGTQANLKRFALPSFDLTDKAFRVICRISDVTKIGSLNFYVGTSSVANYFKWKLWEISGSAQPANSGEWATFTFGWASLNAAAGSFTVNSNGSPSTTTGFTDLQIQAVATSGQAITLDVQAIEIIDATTTTFPNGVVSVVFDDGAQSIWDYARPAMDTYGFRGTNYVIVGNLGTGGVMTTAENRQLQDFSGWEIALHSYDATLHDNRYTSYTAAQVDADFRNGKLWLVRNGFRGEGAAYPGGEYQRTTDGYAIDDIASRYFNTGRTIIFQSGGPTETFPAGMPMRMRAVSSISSTQSGAGNPANLVAAGGLLDKCQACGGWLILVFHKLVTGTPAVATECSVTDFQTIMAGISSRGIPVVPVSDVQRLYS